MAEKAASREIVTTIAQRFSPDTFRSMDLVRWYISLTNDPRGRGEASTDKTTDSRESRNQIVIDALEWFVQSRNNKGVKFPALKSGALFRSFAVPNTLYRAIKAIAEREEVRLARAVDTAIQLYCEATISEEMQRYYDTVQRHGSALLRARQRHRDR